MKVHHLNCGTLYPFGCGEMVCHVLLVETGNGLVLIDTGFGPKDCDAPTRRVGASRYLIRSVLWEHGPKIVEHTPDGEKWRGFATAKELDEVSQGIALISLTGHTRGHACVAVDAGHRWVVHCGDAFFHHRTVDGTAPMPRALAAFETVTAFDLKMMRQNHARLTELYRRREPDMLMVCSHDGTLYEQAKATT